MNVAGPTRFKSCYTFVTTVKTFLNLRVADQPILRPISATENTTRVVIPFEDHGPANIMKTRLKDLSVKLQTIVQAVFTSRKIQSARRSRQANQSLSSLINSALCIISSVTVQCWLSRIHPWTSVRTRR